MESIKISLRRLYHKQFGRWPKTMTVLYSSGGSRRKYFRLSSRSGSAVGAWNPVKEENRAFLEFSRHFLEAGLHVPVIYQADEEHDVYLTEDLGDITLLGLVDNAHRNGTFPLAVRDLYQQALKELINFQIKAGKTLDYRLCYPRDRFDSRSMTWDLNYFKYYFLKLHCEFHEERLEEDFTSLVHFLDQAGSSHFMYRDFQARNILVKDGQVYFLDFQGGRRGPLQYDVASLLYQARSYLSPDFREEMLEYYLSHLQRQIPLDARAFREYYEGFVLIRLLQVLGAYGYRGLVQKKSHFLQSLPVALENLKWWLVHARLPVELPELIRCLDQLANCSTYNPGKYILPGKLTVDISSFSYKNGIPDDFSGYGGGFVFDCRALPNPGREEQYRNYTGNDRIIVDYLESYPEVSRFLESARQLVVQAVENYLERNFERLSVKFGCTGGQHRSVYCAEKMAGFLKERYPQINLKLAHPMLDHE